MRSSLSRPSALQCLNVVVTAAVVLWAAPAAAQKVPDLRLDTSVEPAFSTDPRIVASGFAVYVTWMDDRNGLSDIYFNRSLDAGASWLTSDLRLDTDALGSAASWSPQIAASGAEVYVLWCDERGGATLYFNRSLDGGATWLATDQRIDTGPGKVSSTPRIAVSGTAVYATWEDGRSGSSDVYFNRSLARGTPGTWLAADRRLDSGRWPELAASGDAVHVTWERNGIHYNRSLDRGATWLASSIRVDSGTGRSFAVPQIAALSSAVYVTWADDRSGYNDIYFNRSLDDGASWLGNDVRLSTHPAGLASSVLPALAASESAVYVTWQDDRSAHQLPPYSLSVWDIYLNRSLDRGSTWLAADIRLDTDPPGSAQSARPRIAASGAAVHVTWEDDRDGFGPAPSPDIHFNRSLDGGSTWLRSDARLDTDPPGAADSLMPQIAASGAAVCVAWRDHRNGWLPDIYFNVPFGIQQCGAGTAGSGGIKPVLAGTGYPTLGSAASVVAWNGLGGTAGAMLVGYGSRSKVSLPFLGGTLLVLPDAALPFMLGGTPGRPGVGSGALPFVIPNSPELVGANINFQVLLVDPGAAIGVSMTNAAEMWIG